MWRVVGLVWMATVVSGYNFSSCTPGLDVYSTLGAPLLVHSCNKTLAPQALSQVPNVTFNRAQPNDSYALFLLEFQQTPGVFYLHWFLANIPVLHGQLSLTGATRLSPNYSPPTNKTKYGFYLYNTTGAVRMTRTLSYSEAATFRPAEYLSQYNIHAGFIASTIFNVDTAVPPAPHVNPPYPVTPAHPQPQPYPPQPQPYPPHTQTYPPHPQPYPPQPQPNPPHTQPQPYPPHPQPQPYPPHPQPQPTQPRQPIIYPAINAWPYRLNGSLWTPAIPNIAPHHPLIINNVLYTGPHDLRLTSFLKINETVYSWPNATRRPIPGTPVVINGTHYVPIRGHKKNSASSSTVSLFLLLLPLLSYL